MKHEISGLWPRVLLGCILLLVADSATGTTRGELRQQLLESYSLTKVGIGGLRVVKPGTVFIIQKEGIAGDPSSTVLEPKTIIEDGQVRQEKGVVAALTATKQTRMFEPGEKAYLLRIYVGGDNVALEISSFDTHTINVKGSTKQVRYNGLVAFRFPKDKFQSMAGEEVKAAVDQFLRVEEEVNETTTIEVGQSVDLIEAMLGKPKRILKAGDKVIYLYKDIKITFVNGTVADVE